MRAKKLLAVIAMAATLLLQAQSCMAAPLPTQQDMQCCKAMSCEARMSQACCPSMASPAVSSSLPSQQRFSQAPPVILTEYLGSLNFARGFAPAFSQPAQTPQHSPPKLYTLHASLLI